MAVNKYWIMGLVGLVLAVLVPLVLGDVEIKFVAQFAAFSVFAVSLNLLLSYTGLLSFGHALFFGVGGYATALAVEHLPGLSLMPVVLIGALAAALVALLCSPLLVRVKGTAFAMLTLAFGQLMYMFCLKFREITKGEDGIPFTPPELLYLINMNSTNNTYYFVMIVCALSIWFMWFFTKTPLGSIMISVRDNTDRVSYLGFKVPQTKAIIFTVSGIFAGVAGSMFALLENLVSPDGWFSIMESFAPLMAILIGGIGTFIGPIFGVAVLFLIEELATKFTERVELVSGVIFVLVVLFAPGGLVWLYRISKAVFLFRRAGARASKRGEEAAV